MSMNKVFLIFCLAAVVFSIHLNHQEEQSSYSEEESHDAANVGALLVGKTLTNPQVVKSNVKIEYSKNWKTKSAVYNVYKYQLDGKPILVFLDQQYKNPATITLNTDYQYGLDKGGMFIVRNNAQVRADGIYQWRFTQAVGQSGVVKGLLSGGAKLVGDKFNINLSGLFGDYLREFA